MDREAKEMMARTPQGAPADRALMLEDDELRDLVREYSRKVDVLKKANQDVEGQLARKDEGLRALQTKWTEIDPNQAARIQLKNFVDLVAELQEVRDGDRRLAEKENALSQTHETQQKLAEAAEDLERLQKVVDANDSKIAQLRAERGRSEADAAQAKARARARRELAQRERLEAEKRRLRESIESLTLEVARMRASDPSPPSKPEPSPPKTRARARRRPRRPLRGLDDDDDDDDNDKAEESQTAVKPSSSQPENPEAQIYDALLAPFAGIDLDQ